MRFVYTITVEVERTEGKFASRDEIGEAIEDAISSADIGSFEGENGGQYDVTDWTVEAAP